MGLAKLQSTGYPRRFPSMGAWTTWALGTENENLPSYVAISDPRGTPQSSVNNWGPGFLPAAYQGTEFNAVKPLGNLDIPKGVSAQTDQQTRNFLNRLNQQHLQSFPGDTELAARISSYELAARMQLTPKSPTCRRVADPFVNMERINPLRLNSPETAFCRRL